MYYFKITHIFTQKNKLDKFFYENVKLSDSLLLKDSQAKEKFLKELQSLLERGQKEFRRCKPLDYHVFAIKDHLPESKDMTLGVQGSWSATIYNIAQSAEIKDEFLQFTIHDPAS